MNANFSSPWFFIPSDSRKSNENKLITSNFNVGEFIRDRSFENIFLKKETSSAIFYSVNYTKDESSS